MPTRPPPSKLAARAAAASALASASALAVAAALSAALFQSRAAGPASTYSAPLPTRAVGGSEHQTRRPSWVPSMEKRSRRAPAASSTTPSAKRTSLNLELTRRTPRSDWVDDDEDEGEARGAFVLLPQRRNESADAALAIVPAAGPPEELVAAASADAASEPPSPVQEVRRHEYEGGRARAATAAAANAERAI